MTMDANELRALADALERMAQLERYGSPGALALESATAYLTRTESRQTTECQSLNGAQDHTTLTTTVATNLDTWFAPLGPFRWLMVIRLNLRQ